MTRSEFLRTWMAVLQDHQRLRAQIAWVKEQIGQGQIYENSVARVLISERGIWSELLELPEDFTGGSGDGVSHQFLDTDVACKLAKKIYHMKARLTSENTQEWQCMMIYGRGILHSDDNLYLANYFQEERVEPAEFGRYRPEVLPLHLKVQGKSQLLSELFGWEQMTVFLAANIGEGHLLAQFRPTPLSIDIGRLDEQVSH